MSTNYVQILYKINMQYLPSFAFDLEPSDLFVNCT